MAVAIASVQSGTATNSGATVTKDVATAVGDVLFGIVTQNDGIFGNSFSNYGFTTIFNTSGATPTFESAYRIVDGSEPSSWTVGQASVGSQVVAAVIRVTGAALDPATFLSSTNNATATNATTTTLTPTIANSLIIEIVANNNGRTTSGYTLATSAPTFTESLDLQNGSGSLAVASGVRPQITATGTATATMSGSATFWMLMLVVPPPQTASFTAPLLALTVSLFTQFVTATASLLSLNLSLPSQTQSKWTNQSKNTSSWTNQNKS